MARSPNISCWRIREIDIHGHTDVPTSEFGVQKFQESIRILSLFNLHIMCFPGGISGKEPACSCRRCKRHSFDPWVEKIPWSRKWQPTPVFSPGEPHGQGSLEGYSPWGSQQSTEHARTHTHTHQLFEMQWLDFLPIPESHTEQEALRSPHSLFLGLVPAQCLVAGSWGLAGFVAVGWQAWWAAAVAGWWWLSEKLDWSVLEQPTKKGSVSGTTKINFTASQFSWNLLDLGD